MKRFGATILDAQGLTLSADEKAFFREADPFGFILFARNIDTPEQVRRLCAEMRESVGREAPITIDQEGGRVQRLRAPTWREWLPPMDEVNAAQDQAERSIYLRYRIIADELRALGIDSNCAPQVDVAWPDTHPFLKNRCYGFDPGKVGRIGRAAANGLLDGGVLPVIKHIPGHGRALTDSHLELPRVDVPVADLQSSDFAPFRFLSDLPMGMTAHITYPAIGEKPATLNADVMQIIRQDIGFDGLIMTDDLLMKALSGDLADLALGAISAGCDVVLLCNATLAEREKVADAAGLMSDKAQMRAERALAARIIPEDIDISALEAQHHALIGM